MIGDRYEECWLHAWGHAWGVGVTVLRQPLYGESREEALRKLSCVFKTIHLFVEKVH